MSDPVNPSENPEESGGDIRLSAMGRSGSSSGDAVREPVGLRKRKTLRSKLVWSHLIVAGLGLLVLLITLFVTLRLRDNAMRLANLRGPTVRDTNQALAGVQRSLASLRGWMVLGDSDFIIERDAAWGNEIEPALKRLTEISDQWEIVADRKRLNAIKSQLRDLKESQWWIEDVAQTPGNEPARVLVDQELQPIAEEIQSAIEALIAIEQSRTAAERRRTTFALSGLRDSFTNARNLLGVFVDQGSPIAEKSSREFLQRTVFWLDLLQQREAAGNDEQELMQLIVDGLRAYQVFAEEVFELRKSDQWNVAQYRLANEAAPLAQNITEQLHVLTTSQESLMSTDARFVNQLSYATIGVSVIMIVLMGVLAILLSNSSAKRLAGPIEALSAATIEMADEKLDHDIPVVSDDELGDLTVSFNRMRSSLQTSSEALKRAVVEAKSADRAKSEFLANMSHEIRTPLNAVLGMTELVLETQLDQVQREYLVMVKDSGESLLTLINDILDFSKIEAGKLELDYIPFEIRETLGDTLKTLAMRLRHKNVEITFNCHVDVPPVLRGDPHRLRQIVTNLVGNAIKFTKKGEIAVEAKVDSQTDDRVCLHLSVRDTGIGIPDDKLAKIFAAFSQVDASTSRRFGGTGLGLAITSRLVALMNGKIWVESETDVGSTFHTHLEFDQGFESEMGTPKLPITIFRLRVLIVDDNHTNLKILFEMLRNWDMRPTTVDNAKDAIKELAAAREKGAPYSLVLSDVHMPDVDGFELIKMIREDAQLQSTVIMMLSSGDTVDDVNRCRELGGAAHLIKPVKQSELFDAIVAAAGVTEADAESKTPAESFQVGPLRILLAEDSYPNQRLAVGLLSNWGHEVVVANNGREAVETLSKEVFDLVLMDIQMPEMDGYQATAIIREKELRTNEHIPIIAMTAHAMKGDREECLAAGMDEYVSKPIRKKDLSAAIAAVIDVDFKFMQESKTEVPQNKLEDKSTKAIQGNSHTQASELKNGPSELHHDDEGRNNESNDRRLSMNENEKRPLQNSADVDSKNVKGGGIIDWVSTLELLDGDNELLCDVLSEIINECPVRFEEMKQAIDSQDAKSLCRNAHTVRGNLRIFGETDAATIAGELEDLGKSEQFEPANNLALQLKGELDLVLAEIKGYVSQNGQSSMDDS